MSLRLFLVLALIACACGLSAGWFGYAWRQRHALPPGVRRAPAVQALLRDFERDAWKGISREEARRLGAEAWLLWALEAGNREDLQTLTGTEYPASVRARALVFEPPGAGLTFMDFLDALRERHPDSWLLRRILAQMPEAPR